MCRRAHTQKVVRWLFWLGLVVLAPILAVHISKCPWATHWYRTCSWYCFISVCVVISDEQVAPCKGHCLQCMNVTHKSLTDVKKDDRRMLYSINMVHLPRLVSWSSYESCKKSSQKPKAERWVCYYLQSICDKHLYCWLSRPHPLLWSQKALKMGGGGWGSGRQLSARSTLSISSQHDF